MRGGDGDPVRDTPGNGASGLSFLFRELREGTGILDEDMRVVRRFACLGCL